MLKEENFKSVLESLGFIGNDDIFTKKFDTLQTELKVDFKNQQLIYPENNGFIVNEKQTCNFKQNEKFVVFECVHRLLSQGYKPNHIELEPKWQVGHGASGGRADILIKDNNDKALLIIECKTTGSELNSRYVAFALDKEGKEKRFSRTLKASIERIKTITIKAPSKQEQDNFALEVEKLEQTINQANEIIQKAPKQK